MPVNSVTYQNDPGAVNEILGSMPGSIFRWGNAVLLVLLLIPVVVSLFVSWPQTLAGKAVLQQRETPGKASGEVQVTIQVPVAGSGKIQPGQEVRLSLDRYPRQEFGELTAKVIATAPEDTTRHSLVTAVLINGNRSTTGHRLNIGQFAAGQATIILQRRPLFYQLFPFLY